MSFVYKTGISVVAHFLVIAIISYSQYEPEKKQQLFVVELKFQKKQAPNPPPNPVSPRLVAKSRGASQKPASKPAPILAPEESGTERGKVPLTAIDTNDQGQITYRLHPFLLNKEAIKADYPEHARSLRVEGRVRLVLTVGENGRVSQAKVLSGPAFGLRQAALALTDQMLFLPATDNMGEPKMAQIEHDVIFRLNESN